MTGTLSINMKQMAKFKVCADNVHLHENIMRNRGGFYTLDARPYVEELTEQNIFFTFTKA